MARAMQKEATMRVWGSFLGLGVVLSLALTAFAGADEPAEKAAVAAAEAWLKEVDTGAYDKSWERAAELFRNAVPKKSWEQSMEGVRAPLGAVLERKLASKKYTETLPGAPAGKYVVVQFTTSFANKKEAVETVTPALDKDGTWRVSGYFIR